MADYKVIGGDLKQYGPVSEDDLRRWIADGRLNAMSLVQVYGEVEWKPLSSFPEFADVFADKPPTLIAPPSLAAEAGGERQAALRKIKTPAIGLIVAAVINLLLSVWGLVQWLFLRPDQQQLNSELERLNSELQQLNNPQLQEFVQKIFHMLYGEFGTTFSLVSIIFGFIMSVLILMGTLKMKSLQSYHFAMTAAILSVVPCLTPCCGYVIGLAFGIWALVVLRKPEVKSQFH